MPADFTALSRAFGLDPIDYERSSSGILFSSGCGIGMAVMDDCPQFRYFLDVDAYRSQPVDFEALGVVIGARAVTTLVGFVGWYSLDAPHASRRLRQGLKPYPSVMFMDYVGGEETSLESYITEIWLMFPRIPSISHICTQSRDA